MSLDTVEGLADALTAQFPGIDRDTALRKARQTLGVPEPVASPAEIERDDRILEDEEQRVITKLFRAYGFKVYSTSQKRAAKVSPGIPDLWVTRGERYDREGGADLIPALAFWFETKRQVGGKRTSVQVDFGNECVRAGVGYMFGDRYVAAEWLVELGAAVRDAAGELGISPA